MPLKNQPLTDWQGILASHVRQGRPENTLLLLRFDQPQTSLMARSNRFSHESNLVPQQSIPILQVDWNLT
jgi:hypothetical protein